MRFVNDQELEARILNSKGFVLVAFLEMCNIPCKNFRSAYERMRRTLFLNDAFNPAGGIEIVAIEADENPSEAECLNVMAYPTTLLFQHGEEIGRWEGPYTCESLAGRISEIIKKRV